MSWTMFKIAIACACLEIRSRDEAIFINYGVGELKVGGRVTRGGKDEFWPQPVPCGCRIAPHSTDSGAGTPSIGF